jgi:hypothetical protein
MTTFARPAFRTAAWSRLLLPTSCAQFDAFRQRDDRLPAIEDFRMKSCSNSSEVSIIEIIDYRQIGGRPV